MQKHHNNTIRLWAQVSRFGLWIMLLFCGTASYAQPLLPDMAISQAGTSVFLQWTCQWDKLKSVRIRRSADSVTDFAVIGELKSPQKGAQTYTDPAPLSGDAYYKLWITFSSGLTWSSNTVHIYHELPKVTSPVPAAQVTKAVAEPSIPPLATTHIVNVPAGRLESGAFRQEHSTSPPAPLPVPVAVMHIDTVKPMQRALLRYIPVRDTAAPDVFIIPTYLRVDAATGNILIELPDNAPVTNYSMEIFDARHHSVWQIPRLRQARIILDKRNFQESGVYGFVLKKGIFQIESANFVVR
jgi:hypothetical protein